MTLRRSATAQALVDLEDADDPLLSIRLPGSPIPFWAQVRTQLRNLLSDDELGDAGVPITFTTREVLGRFARSVVPLRSDAGYWRGQRDLAFVVGGTTLHLRDGRARNWLVGSYAEALPDQALIAQRAALPSPLGPSAFRPTVSIDPMLARAEIRIALRRGRPSPMDTRVRQLVEGMAELLGLGGDPRLAAVSDSAVWTERTRPSLMREFDRFLGRVRPQAILFEDASYGSHYASLVAVARLRGITVAEPQHGWIGPSHPSYNYGAAMFRPQNAIALPGTLLTFGSRWGEGLAFPGEVVPVGKPHLEERAARAAPVADRPREVVVVSSVREPEETLRFVAALRAALPGEWAVRFRPHPSERATLDTRYPGLADLEGVVVDERPDVFDSLAACRVVVGVASTVLFEAAALGCRILVRDSPWLPIVVGDLFGPPLTGGDVDRVVRVALEPDSTEDGRHRVPVAELWRPGSVQNFRDWYSALQGSPA